MKTSSMARITKRRDFINVPADIKTEKAFNTFVEWVKQRGNPVVSTNWAKREIISFEQGY